MGSKNNTIKVVISTVLLCTIFVGLLDARKYDLEEKEKITVDEITEDYLDENDFLSNYVPKKYENTEVDGLSLKDRLALFDSLPNGSPLSGDKIKVNDEFGIRIHPITKKRQFHSGIDLKASIYTPVHATADGMVKQVVSIDKGNYGRMIVLYHEHGFETLYAHLKKTNVKEGTVIKKGDIIGYSGNSGRSTGPHLHYEVRYLTQFLNPKDFIKWNMNDFGALFAAQKSVPWDELVASIRRDDLKDLVAINDK